MMAPSRYMSHWDIIWNWLQCGCQGVIVGVQMRVANHAVYCHLAYRSGICVQRMQWRASIHSTRSHQCRSRMQEIWCLQEESTTTLPPGICARRVYHTRWQDTWTRSQVSVYHPTETNCCLTRWTTQCGSGMSSPSRRPETGCSRCSREHLMELKRTWSVLPGPRMVPWLELEQVTGRWSSGTLWRARFCTSCLDTRDVSTRLTFTPRSPSVRLLWCSSYVEICVKSWLIGCTCTLFFVEQAWLIWFLGFFF